ncbi:60S ribosomal protein L23 [Aphelenchoides besseyi]|nr:60S ribosomal protein L23 [Aphelenchoides besseyi]KAI6194934.1 60S ribosomal protein L23 [Aphelenchoides besseyi]
MNFARLLLPSSFQQTAKAFASGRWWPQPAWRRSFSASLEKNSRNESNTQISILSDELPPRQSTPTAAELGLQREDAHPVFASRRGTGEVVYKLVSGRNGELLAGYTLFEAAIKKSEINWTPYHGMTKAEKDVYIAHLRAVEARKLEYRDPHDKKIHKTVSALFYELSKHRTRPPTVGIHRRTRLIVVDNSAIGKEANTSGQLAYCIHVYKPGYRQKHMPKATLGDKVLVAIKGEMKRAYVVGANIHRDYRKHGVPSTDTNNIVLLNEEGNPLGTRVLSPIPSVLLKKRNDLQFSKVLALANKYY